MFLRMIPSFRLHKDVGRIAATFLNYSTFHFHIFKQAHRLRKMVEKMSAKQKKQTSYVALLEKSTIPSAFENEDCSRRVTALNKVYMEHITMMVNSGACGRQLGDLGIEISKIKFARGLNFLNIYWLTRKTDIPEHVIYETLKGVLAELQSEIGTMRFTSKVPLLKFVRDLRLEKELHLQKVFEAADFGKDFQPTHGKKVITPHFVSQPGEFPKMRQDTLGLHHARITERIKTEILRHRVIKINVIENDSLEVKHEMPQTLIKFDKKEFLKFYKRKRILESKIRKMNQKRGDDFFEGIESSEGFWDPLPDLEEHDYEEDENEYEYEYDKLK